VLARAENGRHVVSPFMIIGFVIPGRAKHEPGIHTHDVQLHIGE
jgi:hypothetical protein